MNVKYFLLFVLMSSSSLLAQQLPLDDLDTEPHEAEEYLLWLRTLRCHPLSIHTIRQEDLERLPGMTSELAMRILAYRRERGPVRTLDELLHVEGMTEEVLNEVRPYLRVDMPQSLWQGEGRHRIRYRVERTRGLKERSSGYAAMPVSFLQQVTLQRGERVFLHLTAEQDAGESFRWHPQNGYFGPDYLSFSLRIRDVGLVRTFILGSYRLAFGKGLLIWQGFQQGKGREVIDSATQWGSGLRMHRSSSEDAYMNGVALELGQSTSFRLLLLLSRRARDARMAGNVVRSLSSSGYHRTNSERARRGTVVEHWMGVGVLYRRRSVDGGVLFYRANLSRPLAPEDKPVYRFYLRGKRFTAGSAFARVHLGNLTLMGETAAMPQAPLALSGTVLYRISRRLWSVWSFRWLPASFHGLYGLTVQEAGTYPSNERGGYLGFRLIPAAGWRIRGYVDMYAFPWLRSGRAPSGGEETLLEVRYRRGMRWDVYGLLRTEIRERRGTADTLRVRTSWEEEQRKVRVQVRFRPISRLYLEARGEILSAIGMVRKRGIVLYQEVGGVAFRRLVWGVRATFFDTTLPIYAYERDLPYAFRVAVFSGRGVRLYGHLRYTWGKVRVSFKVEETRYRDRTRVGSGWETIEGNRVHMVSFQLGWFL